MKYSTERIQKIAQEFAEMIKEAVIEQKKTKQGSRRLQELSRECGKCYAR